MPEFGLGFTQCRMRYRNQEELLSVAREHKRRGLPMDMIVADFFHWTIQGDFKFEPADWPDIPRLVGELKSLGIELMVSIWPTVDARSENRAEMEDRGLLIQVDRGLRINMNWMGETCFFDATNPEARAFVWQKAKENYFRHGIKVFWLDEAEPEFGIYDFDLYRYHAGPALKVTNIYPAMYAKGFYDGLKAEGVENPLCLVRTAWAGSQRYGALVWSGDIHSSYRSLREQLAAGLSMAMAGIPWWTTDIGGFHSGYADQEDFRELLVRWFQWGTFCPVFRLHGDRLPYRKPEVPVRNGIQQFGSGSDNELWSFGDQAYPVLAEHLHLRERLRPYLRSLHRAAHEKGTPIMRPLFYDFPRDDQAWNEETAYMLGPDLLVAPILEANQTSRSVYLPAGAQWTNAHTGQVHGGGVTIEAPAPYEHLPLFLKDGARLPIVN
jgi:alpha-D-xyloside xylohydrolase